MQCVYHFVFGISGMNISSLDRYFCRCSVEVFIFQLAYLAAIHRIGPFCTKFIHVEFIRSAADLFVGRESYTYLSVLDLGMINQVFHSGHDLGNTCLVVCAEQGCPVGYDQVIPDKF